MSVFLEVPEEAWVFANALAFAFRGWRRRPFWRHVTPLFERANEIAIDAAFVQETTRWAQGRSVAYLSEVTRLVASSRSRSHAARPSRSSFRRTDSRKRSSDHRDLGPLACPRDPARRYFRRQWRR